MLSSYSIVRTSSPFMLYIINSSKWLDYYINFLSFIFDNVISLIVMHYGCYCYGVGGMYASYAFNIAASLCSWWALVLEVLSEWPIEACKLNRCRLSGLCYRTHACMLTLHCKGSLWACYCSNAVVFLAFIVLTGTNKVSRTEVSQLWFVLHAWHCIQARGFWLNTCVPNYKFCVIYDI